MTDYIDEVGKKQRPKGEQALRRQPSTRKATAPTHERAKPSPKQQSKGQLPTQGLFGDQGDFEDGTVPHDH